MIINEDDHEEGVPGKQVTRWELWLGGCCRQVLQNTDKCAYDTGVGEYGCHIMQAGAMYRCYGVWVVNWKSGRNLWLPAGFSNDFACEKMVGRVTNVEYVTMGCCNCLDCKLVSKCLNHSHMIEGMLQWPQLHGLVVSPPCSVPL